MKIGLFKALSLKSEIKQLNTVGIFIKSYVINIRYSVEKDNKVMFIIKKKLGNAVKRNKIKRQIRACLIANQLFIEKKIHLLILVKPEFLKHSFHENYTHISNLLKKVSNSITLKKMI